MRLMKRSAFTYAVMPLSHILLAVMKPSRKMKLLIILNLPLKMFRMVCGMSVLMVKDQNIQELLQNVLWRQSEYFSCVLRVAEWSFRYFIIEIIVRSKMVHFEIDKTLFDQTQFRTDIKPPTPPPPRKNKQTDKNKLWCVTLILQERRQHILELCSKWLVFYTKIQHSDTQALYFCD